MSYAIIRNENYKMSNLSGIYRHNERKNTNYSNKNINRQNSTKNYSIKSPYSTYKKMFKDIKKEYNLKGQIKKVSNVMCELIITSDKEFFDSIGFGETERYFQEAYNFVANYQNLGEEYIVSAKVHMDESTPHMHIVYIPVVHKKDKQNNPINKVACSEYWKGKDSYKKLQDSFYKYITEKGFELERGNTKDNEHINTEKYKKLIDYNEQLETLEKESIKNVDENNLQLVVAQNKSLKLYVKKLKTRLFRANKILENTQYIEKENKILYKENTELKQKVSYLNTYIDKTFEVVNILFNIPIRSIRNIINNFMKSTNDKTYVNNTTKGRDNNERQ